MKKGNLLITLLTSLLLVSCSFQQNISSSSSSENLSESISEVSSFSSSKEESSSYSSSIKLSESSSSSKYVSSSSSFTVDINGKYRDAESVALYITLYHKLPSNYITKSQKDKYDNTYSIGGDYFGNKEGYLPSSYNGSYRECDIDSYKSSRGAKRIVYETKTYRIFYTTDHYSNFREYYGYKSWSEPFGKSNDIY